MSYEDKIAAAIRQGLESGYYVPIKCLCRNNTTTTNNVNYRAERINSYIANVKQEAWNKYDANLNCSSNRINSWSCEKIDSLDEEIKAHEKSIDELKKIQAMVQNEY